MLAMRSVKQDVIARKLGLSIATVSRSLSNHPAISAETRERVQRMAQELGYRAGRDRDGANGRDRRPCIGVLVGLQPNSSPLATFPQILRGIQERAKVDNVEIEVSYIDPNLFNPESRTDPVMRQVRKGKWRGLILVYPYSPDIVRTLAQKIPIVSTLEEYDQLNVDCIDTNHHTGIVAMVNRLADLGHKRIGFATWAYPTPGTWVSQRFAAFVAGIFSRGLEFRPDWILNMHRSVPPMTPAALADSAVRAIRRDGVTAWVCAADHQAYQLILDLTQRGVRVPEDCSVTGFDGIEPPLSLLPVCSQRVPNEAIGSAALVRLMNRIHHPRSHQRKVLVETQFVEGATLARAAEKTHPPAART